ncbi:MAG: hypothetical protein LKI98_04960 [Bifidobacterium crudilactis]|nr:hypothetical protein [Bifidobacterium crudilactis]
MTELTENDDTQILSPVGDGAVQGSSQMNAPTNPSGADGEDPDAGHAGGGRRGLRALIAVLVAAVLVAAGVFGVRAFSGHISELRQQQALSSCEKNLAAYDSALKSFNESMAKASTTKAVTPEQVDDAQTVSDLKDALQAKVPARKDCPAAGETDQLNANATALDMAAGTLKDNAGTVDKASAAVSSSQTRKGLSDAKNALNDSLTSSRSVLTSSEGKVADDASRTSLQEAITAAEKVLASNDVSDKQQYADAQSALQKAVDAVNASIKTKEEQDASHITTDSYQFDIPDYWKGRVTVQQDRDTVTVYSKQYPSRAICQLRVVETSQMTAGDIGNAMVANATLDSNRSVAIWTTRWGYVAAKGQLDGGGESIGTDEAQELVDLQTGGKATYQQILDAESSGDSNSSPLLTLGDTFIQSTVFSSLKAK